MTHDPAATLGSDPSAAPVEDTSTALTRPESRSDFLDRARRILGGDVRPDDYLPVTPEVEARVSADLAFATEHVKARNGGRLPHNFDLNATTAEFPLSSFARQRNEWLLSLYYGGQNIAYIANNTGIIVLAVGLDDGRKLLDEVPYELRQDVGFGAPLPADAVPIF